MTHETPIRLDEVYAFCSARLQETEDLAVSVGYDRIETGAYLWGAQYLLLQRDNGGESKMSTEMDAELAEHIAHHEPRRVLADVAFKRGVLVEHLPRVQAATQDDTLTPMVVCPVDGDDCPTLRALAALYDNHPDYQASWSLT